MKLSSHPRFHACPTRNLRQLKALSPPFAQSETQPTTALSVVGCATCSARLLSAHNRGGLLSPYFGLFLYLVHIVATVAGVSRPFACVELRRILLLGSSVNRGNPPYPLIALFLVRADRGLNKELQVGTGLRLEFRQGHENRTSKRHAIFPADSHQIRHLSSAD